MLLLDRILTLHFFPIKSHCLNHNCENQSHHWFYWDIRSTWSRWIANLFVDDIYAKKQCILI